MAILAAGAPPTRARAARFLDRDVSTVKSAARADARRECGEEVDALAWSPDGRILASGPLDTTVRL